MAGISWIVKHIGTSKPDSAILAVWTIFLPNPNDSDFVWQGEGYCQTDLVQRY